MFVLELLLAGWGWTNNCKAPVDSEASKGGAIEGVLTPG